ncbi:polyhomeotic-like protein 1 [Biomphalaria pfeifferi]|uniref:Polyhomeotic-like protein 1 n=1 Tax=Biomphalaria pfeifferi TaxID=112525 RepID=A0AAD8BVE7_BIOPF|nr:polyhomeotic-like protein 1 [Biomphalaria pfeifferi]
MNSHQGGIRLNQAQVVNSAGQIITSQPVQGILTNQAIMQAMANLQMQQGIPIATATGHQQIINQGQAQMPLSF